MIWSNPVMNLRHAAYHSATSASKKNDEDLYEAAIRYAESMGYQKKETEKPKTTYTLVDAFASHYLWRCDRCSKTVSSYGPGNILPPHKCEPRYPDGAHWTAPPYRTGSQTLEFKLPTEGPPGAVGIQLGNTYIPFEGETR